MAVTITDRELFKDLLSDAICRTQHLDANKTQVVAFGNKWCGISVDGIAMTFEWGDLYFAPHGIEIKNLICTAIIK